MLLEWDQLLLLVVGPVLEVRRWNWYMYTIFIFQAIF